MTELNHLITRRTERQLCAWCDGGVEIEAGHRHDRELIAQARARQKTFADHARVDEAVRGPWYPTVRGEVGLRWPVQAPWLDLYAAPWDLLTTELQVA